MAEENEIKTNEFDVLEGQPCPMCNKETLTLTERTQEVPYFGSVHVFSMTCQNCKFHKSDVETTNESNDPSKYTFEIQSEEDLKVRVIKSSNATVKIPRMFTMSPGPASPGFITNVEGILNRAKHAIKSATDMSEDNSAKKKSKNMLKKLNKVAMGHETLKIIIEDPSGNSAIVSDKAEKKKL